MLIERYIGTEILKPFMAGLTILATIFIAFSAATRLSDAASGAISSAVILQLIFLNTLISLEVLVPTTLYFAILFALGRLYRDSEMAALAAAGVGERQLLRTVFKLGFVAAVLVAALSVYVRPWAYYRTYALEQSQSSRLDVSNITPGKFMRLGDAGHVLHVRAVEKKDERLREVFLQLDRESRSQVISAASARLLGPDAEGSRAIQFFNGHAYLLDRQGGRDVDMKFHTLLLRFAEEERISKFRRKAVATGVLGQSGLAKDIAEYQWRVTTPIATLLLALLAVPLSRASPRQSRFGGLAVALVAYVLLFSASGAVRNGIENGDVPPFPGLMLAYLPAAVLLIVLLAAPRLATGRWR